MVLDVSIEFANRTARKPNLQLQFAIAESSRNIQKNYMRCMVHTYKSGGALHQASEKNKERKLQVVVVHIHVVHVCNTQ